MKNIRSNFVLIEIAPTLQFFDFSRLRNQKCRTTAAVVIYVNQKISQLSSCLRTLERWILSKICAKSGRTRSDPNYRRPVYHIPKRNRIFTSGFSHLSLIALFFRDSNLFVGVYGKCRILGCSAKMLPSGLDPFPGKSKCALYCPKCDDIFTSDSELDSAFFGQNLPVIKPTRKNLIINNTCLFQHMFFMVKKEKRPVSLLKKIYSFSEQDELSLTYPVKWILE